MGLGFYEAFWGGNYGALYISGLGACVFAVIILSYRR
jgi:hypothetical protein